MIGSGGFLGNTMELVAAFAVTLDPSSNTGGSCMARAALRDIGKGYIFARLRVGLVVTLSTTF